MIDKIIPAPGYLIVEPITSETSSGLSLGGNKGKIGKGKVLAIGAPVTTDYGTVIDCSCRIGDTVYFLRYENQYDEASIDGKTYVFASFRDIRANASN